MSSTARRDRPDASGAAPARSAAATRLARLGLLATVFVCAACALVYQLALVTLGSFLIGDTATQASIVIATMMFAMGVGALAAKPLQKRAASSFALIEILLALFGGLSVLVLYAAFAWLNIYTFAVVVFALLLGALIGAEIPLLMVLLQRIRRQSAGSAVADLNAADYVGALLGGMAFPFLLLPLFGQLRGVIVVGAVNAIAGLVLVYVLFRRDLGRRARWTLTPAAVAVAGLLLASYVYADRFEATAQQAMFAHPIIYTEQTSYQQIVMTQSVSPFTGDDVRLYLNGDLQFSSVDEYRYHEALVHPAMAGEIRDVLVLGGGDGLALREILRYPDVESATLVELDPAMTRLGQEHPKLTEMNRDAFDDPRVSVVNDDAFQWLGESEQSYDVIVVDMPDPDSTATAKLYSVEFYTLAAARLHDDGVMSVQSGSPFFAPKSFWCINQTLSEAEVHPRPYQVSVPSFGDWGFHLVAKDEAPQLRLNHPGSPRFLDQPTLDAAAVFPADRPQIEVPASTVLNPIIMDFARSEWRSGA